MATYSPPSFPRRPNPKTASLFSELQYQAHLLYYRYEINTALYVMSPGEKIAYNFIFLSFLVFFLSATYFYLPTAIHASTRRLAYYFTGSIKLDVARMSVVGVEVLRSTGNEAVRSLSEAARGLNGSTAVTP